MSLKEFNGESHAERLRRRARVAVINSGQRSAGGLTQEERILLATIQAQGAEIERSWMVKEKPDESRQPVHVVNF